MQKLNREAWLTSAAQIIKSNMLMPLLSTQEQEAAQHGFKVSIAPTKTKVLGSCWATAASEAGINEIFISAKENDSLMILATLTHEIIHHLDDCASGHKRFFAKVARKIGLIGKLTATQAGETLQLELYTIIDELGEIPHAALNSDNNGIKKQKSRSIKIECRACTFGFTASRTQLERLPANAQCPCCNHTGELLDVKADTFI